VTIESATHSSLIQGISQQADVSRGTASAEDQENCLNEVLDGVVSRMGSTVISAMSKTFTDPFVYEIRRSSAERYVVLIEGGQLTIINRVSGQLATITGNIAAYLAQSGSARLAFQAATFGDTTFLLNRTKSVAMATGKSAARPNNGCFYIRAGGYLVTYALDIIVGGKTYTATYKTPDNSAAANAERITTDFIAEQFRLALVNTIIPAIAADGNGTFTVTRRGSTVVLTAPAANTFDIRTSDGVGDTYMKSFTDTVKTIADLPAKCVDGYQVSMAPNGGSNKESFFLRYTGGTDTGRWVEIVKWDTVLGLNAGTMPQLLINTGLNTFEVKAASWGTRVSGDGQYTSVNPSFVGYPIRSIQFISGRLAVVSEFNMSLSRARNGYVFFPDTAQTNLDSAPIDYDISNGSSTLMEYSVMAGGKLQFWGDGQQTYLDSGQDAIKESTTEVLGMANYEYDGQHPPKPIGMSSLMFGTAIGRWGKITEVFLSRGLPQGEINITDHVPKLLDGSMICISPGEAAKKAMVLTSNKRNLAYLYQWYNQGSDRVQSAWNRWSFPNPTRILWATLDGDTAYFLFQWSGIVTLESVRLDSTGDELDVKLPLRLDHRVDQSRATFSTDRFVLTLPYPVPTARQADFRAYERDDISGKSQRGRRMAITWVNTTTVHILCDDSTRRFFFGSIPVAKRKSTRFYARDRNGEPVVHDKLLLKNVKVSHKDTVEYEVRVIKKDGTYTTQTYTGRMIGDPLVVNDQVPIKTGSFKADIGAESEDADVELVNPTPFPCTWTSLKYVYDITLRTA